MPNATVQQLVAEIQALSPAQRAELLQQLALPEDEAEPTQFPITPRITGSYTPKDRSQEWQWLAEHGNAYAGQWVALEGNRLVAFGTTFKDVLKATRQAGMPDALLVRAEATAALHFV